MDRFINRVLRRDGNRFIILVNNERIGEVVSYDGRGYDWIARSEDRPAEHVPYVAPSPVFGSAQEAAVEFCARAEQEINDFFFVIEANPEPDEPANLYFVDVAARGSGRVIDSYTASDPYAGVASAREAQAYSLEERWEMEVEREAQERAAWGVR
jgi:hypothetical protein